jgi:hypothetical protein
LQSGTKTGELSLVTGEWSKLIKKLIGLEDDMTLQDFLELHFPEDMRL